MKNHLVPVLLSGTTLIASALNFHEVTAVAVPNMIDGNAEGNPLLNIIEGVGVGFETDFPHARLGGTWYTTDPGGFPSNYIVANPGDEIVILDLGADTTLYELSYWGYSDDNGNGIREFEVRFATDAEGGERVLGDEAFGTSLTLNPSFTALLAQTPRQSFSFGGSVTARYVEMTITDNWKDLVDALPGGDRVGFGEVAFPFFPGGFDRFLKVIETELLASGQFAITFYSTPGITYELERSLDGLVWERLADTVTSGAEEFSTINDSSPLAAENVVLYRIIHPGR